MTATPPLLHHIVAAAAAVAWLARASFVRKVSRQIDEPVEGEANVATKPAVVARHLAQYLAQGATNHALRRASIDAATDHEVRWHSTGATAHRGVVTTTPSGNGTRARWEITGQVGLLGAAKTVVVVGAIVVAGLYCALRAFVVTSDHEAVRWQALQMVQAVHVLWPPFLLAGLARKMRREVVTEVQRVLANAPYAGALPASPAPASRS